MNAPVVIDDDLDTDDSVILVLRPEEVKHESHDLIREGLEEVVVRKSLDDLKKGVTEFLRTRGTLKRHQGSVSEFVPCGRAQAEGRRGKTRRREEGRERGSHLLSRVLDEDWRSFSQNLGESWQENVEIASIVHVPELFD